MNDDARTGPDRTDEVARRMRALREALAEERARRAFAIDTPRRVAHFPAQPAHESALYSALVENLNYGARGLLATWPRRLQGRRGPPRRRPRGRARPAGDAALRRAGGGLVLAGARDQRPLRPR